MRTVIIGAGTVGYHLASHLTREDHDIIVLDRSPDRLARIEERLDVQTLVGDGCDPRLLGQAIGGKGQCLVLAVTDTDAVNLVVSFAAKRLGATRTVARVRSRFYLDAAHVNFRDPLGIDVLLSPEILTALELANFVDNPAAFAIASLAQGRIQVRTVMLSPFSEFSTRHLRELSLPAGVLVAAIRRGTRVFTPRGDATLEAGDRVMLIGLPSVIDKVHPVFDTEQDTTTGRCQRVAIAGAGETGLFLAQRLEERGHHVTLIDIDRARCEIASEALDHSIVLHGDCTDVQFLREERLERAGYFVAVTGDDESNIMSALLAKELHIDKTACLIDRPDYVRVVERVGIDIAMSPRIVAANRILKLLRQGRIRSVTLLEDGAIEVAEYQALASSEVVGTALKDAKLPKNALVGAIVRGSEVMIPRGDDEVRPGDIVITVAEQEAADEIDDLFRHAG